MFYTQTVQRYGEVNRCSLFGSSDSETYQGAYQDTLNAVNMIEQGASNKITNLVISGIKEHQDQSTAPNKLKWQIMVAFEVNSNGNE